MSILPEAHRLLVIGAAVVIGSLGACSSAHPAGGAAAPDASVDSQAMDVVTSPGTPDDAAADDASGDNATAPITDAGSERDSSAKGKEVDASTACVKFCACMAMNCANEVFPGGCLEACATQTDWDLACRAVMCSLVQAQPNNDHCTHAFGVDQCLDQ